MDLGAVAMAMSNKRRQEAGGRKRQVAMAVAMAIKEKAVGKDKKQHDRLRVGVRGKGLED